METLFLMGIWFWAILIVGSIVLFICAEQETGFGSFAVIVAGLVLMNWLGGVPVWNYMVEHYWMCLIYFFLYFLVGSVWCFIKWGFYSRNIYKLYVEYKTRFIKERGLSIGVNDPIPEDVKHHFYFPYAVPPEPEDNKNRIFAWISAWPWSLVWTLIDDPIRTLLNHIYDAIKGMLRKISHYWFKDIKFN